MEDELIFGDEDETYLAHLPWALERSAACENCARAKSGGCAEHALGMPRVHVPGGPGPMDVLPCVGKQPLFDTEVVTTEHRMLCGACPFQDWCLENATQNDEHWVWAATNREDRKALQRREAA